MVTIDHKALWKIKDFAAAEYDKIRTLGDLDTNETMQVCLFRGLERYLYSLGKEPGFTVKVNGVFAESEEIEDYEGIED